MSLQLKKMKNGTSLGFMVFHCAMAPMAPSPDLRKELVTDQNTAPALGSPSSTMMLERGSLESPNWEFLWIYHDVNLFDVCMMYIIFVNMYLYNI